MGLFLLLVKSRLLKATSTEIHLDWLHVLWSPLPDWLSCDMDAGGVDAVLSSSLKEHATVMATCHVLITGTL